MLIYVHAANDPECRIPTGLLDIYSHLKRVAVISKADLPDADVAGVKQMLAEVGFKPPMFVVNSNSSTSLEAFKAFLTEQYGQDKRVK